ncbi:MAG: UbiD family decarboxylase, partial [Candidatus Methanomethylophilaceae archaeon]|nr:UbiD family decarboxylase [Candidatus Methanomethylophilaceae archaeon]
MSVKDSLFGEITTIKTPVEPESKEVSCELMKDQDKTVLFESLNGKKAAGNIFSTREKIAKALNIPKEDIVKHLLEAIGSPQPCQIVDDPSFRQCSLDVDLMK